MAGAAAFEPVSTPKFPANREINRECRRIRALGTILNADTRANSKASSRIPYKTEQGIFSAEQGIPIQEQGIFSAKSQIITDEVFGTHRVGTDPTRYVWRSTTSKCVLSSLLLLSDDFTCHTKGIDGRRNANINGNLHKYLLDFLNGYAISECALKVHPQFMRTIQSAQQS